MLCKYSEIFGKPGEGAHSIRILDIAVVDVIMTVVACYFLHNVYFNDVPFHYILLGGFVTGIIAHRLFCVRTTIDKLLFS